MSPHTKQIHLAVLICFNIRMVFPEAAPPDQRSFFSKMALELFGNVHELYKQVDAQFRERQPDESVGAQMAVSFGFQNYPAYLFTYHF